MKTDKDIVDMMRANEPRTDVNFRKVFFIVIVPFWRKVRRYRRDSSFTYFRIHLLWHTSGNCDERMILLASDFSGAIEGTNEIPVTRPMRNAAAMEVSFTGWTLPNALFLPLYLRRTGGKRGAVGQVGFGPHRNKPL
jgi:hypothetical protein